ncbi:MAG: hypothetical protein KDI28_04535 [Pseudomonadales bacterium]|nr:hypothetical protein [Pseudomonadales bacterium]MCP5358647.1 hypothetical protein [Pseudomonadales bacterium]
MIADIVVWGSLICAALYCGAWLLSPRLREQIEQPKHQFQQQVQHFDTARREAGQQERSQS